jgi:hypothetical protein
MIGRYRLELTMTINRRWASASLVSIPKGNDRHAYQFQVDQQSPSTFSAREAQTRPGLHRFILNITPARDGRVSWSPGWTTVERRSQPRT